MSADTPTIVLSVLEHLASIEPEHPAETRPQLQTAMSSLSEAFNVSLDDPKQVAQYSLRPHTLASIVSASGAKSAAQQLAELQSSEAFTQFVKVVSAKGYFKGVEEGSAEYSDRMSKLVAKFKARTEAASGGPAVEEAGTSTSRAIPPPTAENKAAAGGGGAPSTGAKAAKEKKAEAVKGQGNKLLLAKDYEGAERCYTEALELSPEGPNSHVYLCNRAAALCYLSRNDDAVVDCQESIDLNPSYAKAYTRLGYAYFQLEDYEAAAKAYKKSLEIEPGNVANTKSLRKAMGKLGKEPDEVSTRGAAGQDGGGAGGGLAALMASMGGGGSAGEGGLSGMMNNPKMMEQAQHMMKNPAMMSQVQSMLANPQMMQGLMGMMGGGGGGSGGGPDMSALAGMMGGMGGGAGSGGSPDLSALAGMMGGMGGGAGEGADDGGDNDDSNTS